MGDFEDRAPRRVRSSRFQNSPGDDQDIPADASSIELLQWARQGHPLAQERLWQRYLPLLTSWASGRLPPQTRDLVNTQDIVQETFLKTLGPLNDFEPQRHGAFFAYLRTALMNRIRDEIKRARRRISVDRAPSPDHFGHPVSPVEEAIGAETLSRYELALSQLKPMDRELIITRMELGMNYEEIAEALGKPTREAARVAVGRALLQLAKEMGHHEEKA